MANRRAARDLEVLVYGCEEKKQDTDCNQWEYSRDTPKVAASLSADSPITSPVENSAMAGALGSRSEGDSPRTNPSQS